MGYLLWRLGLRRVICIGLGLVGGSFFIRGVLTGRIGIGGRRLGLIEKGLLI